VSTGELAAQAVIWAAALITLAYLERYWK
jgi:hypothetical protein